MMEAALPDFRARRVGSSEALGLYRQAGVEVVMADITVGAVCMPPRGGKREVFLSRWIPHAARPFVLLHEFAHIVAGHSDEHTYVILDERRYPMEDQVADAVAAIGVTTPAEREWPAEDLAERLRELVPVDSRAWMRYRSNDVAMLIGGAGGPA